MKKIPVSAYVNDVVEKHKYPCVEFSRFLFKKDEIAKITQWCQENFNKEDFLIYVDSVFFTYEEQATLFRIMFTERCK